MPTLPLLTYGSTVTPRKPGQYLPAERGVDPGPFPPGKSGGLIEAWIGHGWCDGAAGEFRRVNPAASLSM